jgi:hypothetical protein
MKSKLRRCWRKKYLFCSTWYYVPRWPNGINPLNYTNRGVPVKILSVDETASLEIEALAKVISLIKHFALPTIIKIDFLEEEICSALQNSEVKNEVETCNGQFNFQNLLKCSFIHFLVNHLIDYLNKNRAFSIEPNATDLLGSKFIWPSKFFEQKCKSWREQQSSDFGC